uniref:Prolyl 4-hydroxylase alpha subunit domain-containing protein n=1 Tax=Craspedostauros australis TaxID=1486917 RepID=A0A7R9WS05_9STRA|mmetsp:Transcript_15808/g.43635  ORF Transcript_15808/g.43635 Transcript_15808/m.43635 type:complete len:310 (+) Transcript_15808:175-1104(+)|eukprot:CAMPEP_0198125232 /NCGR_PEP_ID=MMETSP1442-20131203/42126_1 /TAXON_ID= /ORGANISM="Craspedostauros australis, Strain CCMP3328" /LENGTH=309 /DNA_ID=CAMNT_0043784801 /DNA_START=79 /DNA_END=1008 /DNA_ORIENTATION=+
MGGKKRRNNNGGSNGSNTNNGNGNKSKSKSKNSGKGKGSDRSSGSSPPDKVSFPLSLLAEAPKPLPSSADGNFDYDYASYNKMTRKPLSMSEYHHPNVWIIPNFMTLHECQNWIAYCEDSSWFEYTQHNATRYIAQRECYRIQQPDAHCIAQRLFERLQHSNDGIVSTLQRRIQTLHRNREATVMGLNPNIRVYKYTKGHSFGRHVDGSHAATMVSSSSSPDGVNTTQPQRSRSGTTAITVLVYLSECRGGATRFYDHESSSSFAYEPKIGSMLLHVHGDDYCMEHEAEKVMDGIKYVLRTDVVFGHVG